MKAAAILSMLLISYALAAEDINKSTLTNTDLDHNTYAERKESGIGKNVIIRVHYVSESEPPSRIWLVTLLQEGDEIKKNGYNGRQLYLVGFDHMLQDLKSGKKYSVEGILVEDQGHYSALVVYAKSINEIAHQDGAWQPATRSVVEPQGGDKPQPDAERRSR